MTFNIVFVHYDIIFITVTASNTTHPTDLQEAVMNLVSPDTCRDKLAEFKQFLPVSDADLCIETPGELTSVCYVR